MNWNLKLDLWETEDYNNNLKPLINEIAGKMDKMVGQPPYLGYKPLWIVNDIYYGMRIYTPLSDDYFKLGLTVGHLTFGKVAYQFSNLLSIIYSDPRQVTWFSHILAHMSSFWFLDYLDRTWTDRGDSSPSIESHLDFAKLKSEKIRTAFQNIDIMLNLTSNEWIKEEIDKLSSSSDYAPPIMFDHLGLEILPLFEEEESWKLFSYIGKATRKPVEDSLDLRIRAKAKPDFDKLREIVPSELKSLVDNIVRKLVL
jgi:hypothetical protein